jgi:hypothetical protein
MRPSSATSRWSRFLIRKCGAPWPRSALRGKAIIDCNNPVEVEHFTLVAQPGRSMAQYIEQVDRRARDQSVQSLHVRVWQMAPSMFDERRLVVP